MKRPLPAALPWPAGRMLLLQARSLYHNTGIHSVLLHLPLARTGKPSLVWNIIAVQ